MKRIALFGGTFDPVHEGHLHIAQTAVNALQLDAVIFIPCQQSPHKTKATQATGAQRLEMLRLATQGYPWASVDPLETLSLDPSFSWKTAEEFTARFPESELFWLIGDDQWETLHRWARIDYLNKLVTFIVHSRHHEGLSTQQKAQPAITIQAEHLNSKLHPASATQIRRDLSQGQGTPWLAPSVAHYIKKHGLYQEDRAAL